MSAVIGFASTFVRLSIKGGKLYYGWMAFLTLFLLGGAYGYYVQFNEGLIATAMRDEISWGFYIGNFAFLVGVAAAAVTLVIPAYVYNWGPIKEVAIIGEFLAVAAVIMAMTFVGVDLGSPLNFPLHIMPAPIGRMNFPWSILSWDILVLNAYFAVNAIVAAHILYKASKGEHYNKQIVYPLVFLSIPMAVSIHTVTAFVFNGLGARAFWNAAILAPRFIASAFCSGPAVLLIAFQIIRKHTNLAISNKAIWKVAELMTYAMFINLFLLAAEVFKDYYSATEHLTHMQAIWEGLHGYHDLVPFAWTALLFSLTAFFIFLFPRTRKNFLTMNIGCVLIFLGAYMEKGMLLVLPGFVPATLGEIYAYTPTAVEWMVGCGIWALGAMIFTLLAKVGIQMLDEAGQLSHQEVPSK